MTGMMDRITLACYSGWPIAQTECDFNWTTRPTIKVARSANFEILQVLLQEFKKIISRRHQLFHTLQGINISQKKKEHHLEQNASFLGDMLVPWRVASLQWAARTLWRRPMHHQRTWQQIETMRWLAQGRSGNCWETNHEKSLKISEKTIWHVPKPSYFSYFLEA